MKFKKIIPFVEFSWIFLSISILMFFICIILIGFKGIKTSIDFRGGTIVNVTIDSNEYNLSELRNILSKELNQSVSVVEIQSNQLINNVILTMDYLSNEEKLELIFNRIYDSNYQINKVESIGPKIGNELQTNARNAVILSLLLIGFYITVRFDFSYAIGSIVALMHDLIITLGIFVMINLEISIAIIAALLTIVGYSLNDTIVIYDRIRENFLKNPHRNIKQTINESLNQTLNRTIVTSLTTLIVTVVLFIYGGDVLKPFAFTLIIGVILGTYSSLFIASPVLLILDKYFPKEDSEE
tara:strand:- start:791 stop:1684 length:894 start_codon:yes stop_codon:yes gene_type:complete